MKLNVYSIFDKTAMAFITPFFMHNDGIAIRAFSDSVNSGDPNSTIAQHYEQFALYELGVFDDSTGVIDPRDDARCIISGLEVKEPTKEDDLLAEVKTLKDLIIKGA